MIFITIANSIVFWIVSNLDKVIAILVSLVALYFSFKSWSKSRVIYGLETEVIRQPTGKTEDSYTNNDHINKKLSSGNYTVLSVMTRNKSDNDWEILLGRLKPYKQ